MMPREQVWYLHLAARIAMLVVSAVIYRVARAQRRER
jgi:hypothetical protein